MRHDKARSANGYEGRRAPAADILATVLGAAPGQRNRRLGAAPGTAWLLL
jgi:hypothetical protein